MRLGIQKGSKVAVNVRSYTPPGMMYIINPYIIFPDQDHDYDFMVVCHTDDEVKTRIYVENLGGILVDAQL